MLGYFITSPGFTVFWIIFSGLQVYNFDVRWNGCIGGQFNSYVMLFLTPCVGS
jgi:hypothetical protein